MCSVVLVYTIALHAHTWLSLVVRAVFYSAPAVSMPMPAARGQKHHGAPSARILGSEKVNRSRGRYHVFVTKRRVATEWECRVHNV